MNEKSAKNPSKLAIAVAKITRFVAYIVLFLGIIAALGSVIGYVVRYWPTDDSTPSATIVNSANSSQWTPPILSRTAQIVVGAIAFAGVVALVLAFWMLAKKYTERGVDWLNDKTLWPKWAIEIFSLVATWLFAIFSTWILLPRWFGFLALVEIAALVVGMICFGLTRILTRQYLD